MSSALLLSAARRRTSSSWAPTDVAGLALWLDASDMSTLFTDSARTTPVASSGDPVGGWADKSSNSRHLGQSTSGRRPLYQDTGRDTGQPGVVLDDSDDGLTTTTGYVPSGAFTLVFVGKITSTPGGAEYDQVFACSDGTTYVSVLTTGDASYANMAFCRATGATAGVRAGSASISTGKSSTLLIYDGSGTATTDWSCEMSIGTSQTLSSSGAFGSPGTGIFLGDRPVSAFPSGYTYSEVILYESALSGTDLTNLKNYLTTKWP